MKKPVYYGVIDGQRVQLPHYGKYNGIYGYYTRDGFVFSLMDDEHNTIETEIFPIDYDEIVEVMEEQQ